jgi:hypothetical protein
MRASADRIALSLALAALPLAAAGQPVPESPPPAEEPAPEEPVAEEPAPDEPAAEEPAVEGGPVAPRTGIMGRVVDAQTGEGMIEAPVLVVQTNARTLTDLDGNFALELRPGRYTLRSYYDLYQPARVENVTVTAGRATTIEIRLTADSAAVQEVVVTARADRATEATQLQVRRQAATVSDAISAQEIARSPDSTASDSARRVVSATIVDGQYLFVRGLGGRYTSVVLNGVSLPSLDPDVPGVPLDLFPASLLTSMTVVKTFTPDMPGDFAGGLMIINTRDYPSALTLGANLTLGVNPRVTGREVLTYDGGTTDFFGYDDGTRAFPDAVPGQRVEGGRHGLSADRVERIGEAFPNHWQTHPTTALPNLGLGLTAGGTTKLGGRRLGVLATAGFTHNTRFGQETIRRLRLEGEGNASTITVREKLDQDVASDEVLWGTLGTASFELAQNHEVTAVGMFTRSATNATSELSGLSDEESSNIRSTRLRWVERTLGFAQLLGDHQGLPLDARLRWQVSYSTGERTEPDTRDLIYIEGPNGLQWREAPGSGEHFWSILDQTDWGGGIDLTIPILREMSVKIGGLGRFSDRGFVARRFGFQSTGVAVEDLILPPEQLFDAEHIGDGLRLRELTIPNDGYDASQVLGTGYALLDTPLFEGLRFLAGARLETFHQEVTSSSPFASQNDTPPPGTRRTDTDVLPAAALVIQFSENVYARLAYGGTVARPQVRELSPFLYQDFTRRRTITGNPDLERTTIHNLDQRWEIFPSENEVLAASVFYKSFRNPIEQVVVDHNGNITYENVASAANLGAEVEARLSFGRLTPALDAFSLGANLALIYSRVQLTPDQGLTVTNQERPLAGQSPYVANLSLGFSPRASKLSLQIYYNVAGRRIEDVGTLGLPDVYLEPVHSVDLALSWEPIAHLSLKLSAKNVLDQPSVLEQGGIEIRNVRPGPSFSLRLGWSL